MFEGFFMLNQMGWLNKGTIQTFVIPYPLGQSLNRALWLIILFAFSLQDNLKYNIIGDDVAKQFFYLNADTGLLTLKRLLSEDDTAQYNVSQICLLILRQYIKIPASQVIPTRNLPINWIDAVEIYDVPMKFASKLIHGGQVHLCHTQVSTMFHDHIVIA